MSILLHFVDSSLVFVLSNDPIFLSLQSTSHGVFCSKAALFWYGKQNMNIFFCLEILNCGGSLLSMKQNIETSRNGNFVSPELGVSESVEDWVPGSWCLGEHDGNLCGVGCHQIVSTVYTGDSKHGVANPRNDKQANCSCSHLRQLYDNW